MGATSFSENGGDIGVFNNNSIPNGIMFNGNSIHTYNNGTITNIGSTNKFLMRSVFGF